MYCKIMIIIGLTHTHTHTHIIFTFYEAVFLMGTKKCPHKDKDFG